MKMNSTQGWLHAGQDIRLFYTVDDYTDPWSKAQTVVLVHGLAECGEAWRAWVPYLARHYRVVRLDQRGFGQSTPMPQDYPWTLDMLAGDLARLVTETAGGPVDVIGAKIGATVSARFAALHPELVKTLTLTGMPVVGPKRRIGCDPVQHGVLEWARSTVLDRLGASASSEMLEWWSQPMAKTYLSTWHNRKGAKMRRHAKEIRKLPVHRREKRWFFIMHCLCDSLRLRVFAVCFLG